MPTIHLIHGIRDNGDHTTKVLARILAVKGWDVMPHTLLRTHSWHAASRRDTRLLAKSLLYHVEEGDHLICHSHGCNVGWALMEEAAMLVSTPHVGRVVFLAPAMNRKQHFEDVHFDNMLVIHNPVDLAIWAGSFLPFHRFGLAGALGFKTQDRRVYNKPRLSFVGPFNHTSTYFQEPYVEDLADELDAWLYDAGL